MKSKLKKNGNNTLNKRILILIACSFGVVFSLYKLGSYYYDVYKTEKEIKDLQNAVLHNGIAPTNDDEKEMEEILSVDFEKLKSMNSDTRGWIRYNEEKVNYPIVQTQDNEYYLSHSFNKKSNSVGSIFMDYRNKSFDDQNVVLFGHNASNDAMFGSLNDVFKKNFFDEEKHHYIEIMDQDGKPRKYEIFSYYIIEKEEYYITTSFTDSSFEQFINTIQKRSLKKFDTTITTKDKILTLSTCNGRSGTTKRTVIHAKMIEY